MPGLARAWRISAASSAQSMPATCKRSSDLAIEGADNAELYFLDCGKYFLGVAVDLDAVPALRDLAVGADQVGRARHAHVLLSVHRLFLPHAVLLHHRVIFIGEQRELQPVLIRELRLARRIQYADAEHGGLALLELRQVVLERARLLRAAGRVVFWIEVENDGLPRIIGERMVLAFLIGQREGGRFFSGIDHCCCAVVDALRVNGTAACARRGSAPPCT